jgi:hypothetical protein
MTRGRPADAAATLRRSLALAEKHRGAESTAAAKAAEMLAKTLLAVGGGESLAEARRLVERAGTIYRNTTPTPERLAALAELSKAIERAAARSTGGAT